jgi:hypothetical protein
MTSDLDDQPTPAASERGGIKEGIYLEKKKSTIGTGHTAKAAEYRNFWVTGALAEDSVLMLLLDDEFNPTGIRETFSLEILAGPNWFFIAEGAKKYQQLRPLLDQILSAPQSQPAAAKAAPESPAKPKWWEGGASPDGPAANPFELRKKPPTAAPENQANPFELKKKPQAPTPKKGGWWDT